MPYIKIEWSVKFRAFGVTFGNYADKVTVPLPAIVSLAGNLVQPHQLYSYHDHGIQITVHLLKV